MSSDAHTWQDFDLKTGVSFSGKQFCSFEEHLLLQEIDDFTKSLSEKLDSLGISHSELLILISAQGFYSETPFQDICRVESPDSKYFLMGMGRTTFSKDALKSLKKEGLRALKDEGDGVWFESLFGIEGMFLRLTSEESIDETTFARSILLFIGPAESWEGIEKLIDESLRNSLRDELRRIMKAADLKSRYMKSKLLYNLAVSSNTSPTLEDFISDVISSINLLSDTSLSYLGLAESDEQGIGSIYMKIGDRVHCMSVDNNRNPQTRAIAEEVMESNTDGALPKHLGIKTIGESTVLTVPVVFRKKVVGVLRCSLQHMEPCFGVDIEFLTTLANLIATAIESFRYREETKRRNETLNELYEAAKELGKTFEIEDAVKRSLEISKRIFAESLAIIGIISSEEEEISWTALTEKGIVYSKKRFGTESSLSFAEAREKVESERSGSTDGLFKLIPDANKDNQFRSSDFDISNYYRFDLFPISASGLTYGALVLLSARKHRGAEQRNLARSLSANLAIALERNMGYMRAERERAKLSAVFNSMTESVLVVDEGGFIVSMNAAAQKILGKSLEEGKPLKGSTGIPELESLIAGRGNMAGIRMEDGKEASGAASPIRKDATADSEEVTEAEIRLPGQGLRYAKVTIAQMPFEEMKSGRIAVMRDITIEKMLDRIKDDFLSCVSHELKTPITIIKGFCSTLQNNWDNIPDRNRIEFLNAVSNESERLQKIVADLLYANSIRNQISKLMIETFDICKLIEKVIRRFELFSEKHEFELRFNCLNTELRADKGKISQVIHNVVENAVKYSPDGGVISIEAEDDVGEVSIRIRDYGIGISRWNQENLFDMFTQIETGDSRKTQGLGLGLYIVKNFVELHGGAVRVESEQGAGSLFTIKLPRGYEAMPLSLKAHESDDIEIENNNPFKIQR